MRARPARATRRRADRCGRLLCGCCVPRAADRAPMVPLGVLRVAARPLRQAERGRGRAERGCRGGDVADARAAAVDRRLGVHGRGRAARPAVDRRGAVLVTPAARLGRCRRVCGLRHRRPPRTVARPSARQSAGVGDRHAASWRSASARPSSSPPSPYGAIAGMTIAHGVQYLGIVGAVARGPLAAPRRGWRVALLVAAAALGGFALHVAAHHPGAAPWRAAVVRALPRRLRGPLRRRRDRVEAVASGVTGVRHRRAASPGRRRLAAAVGSARCAVRTGAGGFAARRRSDPAEPVSCSGRARSPAGGASRRWCSVVSRSSGRQPASQGHNRRALSAR